MRKTRPVICQRTYGYRSRVMCCSSLLQFAGTRTNQRSWNRLNVTPAAAAGTPADRPHNSQVDLNKASKTMSPWYSQCSGRTVGFRIPSSCVLSCNTTASLAIMRGRLEFFFVTKTHSADAVPLQPTSPPPPSAHLAMALAPAPALPSSSPSGAAAWQSARPQNHGCP